MDDTRIHTLSNAYTLPLVVWDKSNPLPRHWSNSRWLIPQWLVDPPLDGSGDRCCYCCVSVCVSEEQQRGAASGRRGSTPVASWQPPPSSWLQTSCAREDKVFSSVFFPSVRLTLKPTSKGRKVEQGRNKRKEGRRRSRSWMERGLMLETAEGWDQDLCLVLEDRGRREEQRVNDQALYNTTPNGLWWMRWRSVVSYGNHDVWLLWAGLLFSQFALEKNNYK